MMLFPVEDPGDSQLAFSITSDQKGNIEEISLCENAEGSIVGHLPILSFGAWALFLSFSCLVLLLELPKECFSLPANGFFY